MIARSWKARATTEGALAYKAFFQSHWMPKFPTIPGYRGVTVMQRSVDGEIEITVITFWETLKDASEFGAHGKTAIGDITSAATVPEEAQKTLLGYDPEVVHFEVAIEGFPAAVV